MTPEFTGLLWELNPVALIATSLNGEILHWNHAAEIIFGYSSSEATGQSLSLASRNRLTGEQLEEPHPVQTRHW